MSDFYSRAEVCVKIGVSEATLGRMLKTGRFPTATSLSVRRLVWPKRIVDEWISTRRQQSRVAA